MHRLELAIYEGEPEVQSWRMTSQMRMCARETGNRGAAANSVLDLGAVPACYFANVFEKQGFSAQTPLT